MPTLRQDEQVLGGEKCTGLVHGQPQKEEGDGGRDEDEDEKRDIKAASQSQQGSWKAWEGYISWADLREITQEGSA